MFLESLAYLRYRFLLPALPHLGVRLEVFPYG